MILNSDISPEDYREAVRSKLENYRFPWDERFTGHFIGPVFYVVHHCARKWNRRISGETNNAIGFLKKTDTGCQVHFVKTKGILNPPQFLMFCLIDVIMFSALQTTPAVKSLGFWLFSALFLGFCVLYSAIVCTLTDNGEYGEDALLSLLENPTA